MSQNFQQLEKSNPKHRGERLKSLRLMAGLSRKAMADKHDLSSGTLQGWEDGRYGGLTNRGAQRFLEVIRNEGVYCSFDWLMHGQGVGPLLVNNLKVTDSPVAAAGPGDEGDDQVAMLDELAYFRQRHSTAVDLIVSDDAHLPFYRQGDIVAGLPLYGDDTKAAIDHHCIIQTVDGNKALRLLIGGDQDDNGSNIEFAAPIIWHRRKSF